MSEDFTISWFWRKITPEFHDGFAECTTSNIDRKEEGNSFFLYVVKRKCQRWQTSETALVNWERLPNTQIGTHKISNLTEPDFFQGLARNSPNLLQLPECLTPGHKLSKKTSRLVLTNPLRLNWTGLIKYLSTPLKISSSYKNAPCPSVQNKNSVQTSIKRSIKLRWMRVTWAIYIYFWKALSPYKIEKWDVWRKSTYRKNGGFIFCVMTL